MIAIASLCVCQEAITLLLSRYCQLDPNANIAQQTRMCRAMVTLLLEVRSGLSNPEADFALFRFLGTRNY